MKLLIEIPDEDYYDLIEKSKQYPIDTFTKAQGSIIKGTPFPIKFAEDVVKEMDERGAISIPENCMTGEKYEKWLCEDKPCEDELDFVQPHKRIPVTLDLNLARKKGEWIKHDTGHSIYYDCSLCGCPAPCTETADAILWKMANYCCDCGAKMEGVR